MGWGNTISGKGSDNPADSLLHANSNIESFRKWQNIVQIPTNNIKIGNDMLVLLAKLRFQVQMDAILSWEDHFFKLRFQDLLISRK